METFDLKNLKQCLKGICTLGKRIDNKRYKFSQQYLATLPGSKEKVVVKVFDMKEMYPGMLDENGQVLEISLRECIENPAFPKFISSGMVGESDNPIAYLITQYIDGAQTLTEYVRENGPVKVDDNFPVTVLNFISVLKEMQQLIEHGGHFNLNPDNILVKGKEWYVTGFNHTAKSACGKPGFETDMLPVGYRPQESFIGSFSSRNDVYALCITLCEVISGTHPFGITSPQQPSCEANRLAIRKLLKQTPIVDLGHNKLDELISLDLGDRISKRDGDMDELYDSICKAFDLQLVPAPSSKKELKKMMDEMESENAEEEKKSSAYESKIGTREGKGFADVAGMSELKQLLTRDFVKVLKNLEIAKAYGITPPNMILFGPPGCGKTFIANKLAEETGIAYSYVKPSDLGSTFIHGTQGKIADLFDSAARKAPCLLCIDEIDALIPKRGSKINNDKEDEVAEWLTQLNDCASRGVYVVGMTNRISALDEAVIRRGRFDSTIYVPLPDEAERQQLFELSLKNCPVAEGIDFSQLAKASERYSSSDIVSVVKEAARFAFEQTIDQQAASPLPIDQEMILKVLKKVRPSVSVQSLQNYENERRNFEQGKETQTRIGFCA